MTPHLRITLLACLTLICGPVAAQDDLFADTPGLFDAPPADAQAQTEQEEITDPLFRQLLEQAGRGNLEIADSIASLARLGRWSEADRLLARTAGMNIDDATLAAMFSRIGPTVFLQIKQRSDLSDSAQAGMDKLRIAATKYAESEDRLLQAIEQLGSDSSDTQLQGARTLMSGGNAAIAALVAAAVVDQPPAKRDNILRTILALGGGGVDALRQLALYGTPSVRAAALSSLARISRRNHLVDLVTALHATDADEQERAVAIAQLERLDGLPTRDASLEALAFDLRGLHDIAKRIANDDQTEVLWSVNEQRNGVTQQPALAIHAGYRDLYDAAQRLHRVGNLPPDLATAALAVAMGYNLMLDPDWGDADQIQPIRDQFGELLEASSLAKIIDYALKSGDHAATIGLIRLIDPANLSYDQRHALLDGSAGVAAPLVQAANSPEPRVRYEAALKVAALAGDTHYAGSSQVLRTLAEMAELHDKPTVILVETRSDTIIPIETFLRGLGLNVEVAASVAELQRLVAQGGDLRLVIAKSGLSDLPPIEMVDLVRRMNRGHQLPIAVYGDTAPFLGEERWDAPTTWIEGTVTLASLDELLDLVQLSRRMPPLTIIDRNSYREAAADLLSPSQSGVGG